MKFHPHFSKTENSVNPYKVRQLDAEGEVVSEKHVAAPTYDAVLRQLTSVAEKAERIEVYNEDGDRSGEVNVDYWRQRVQRK